MRQVWRRSGWICRPDVTRRRRSGAGGDGRSAPEGDEVPGAGRAGAGGDRCAGGARPCARGRGSRAQGSSWPSATPRSSSWCASARSWRRRCLLGKVINRVVWPISQEAPGAAAAPPVGAGQEAPHRAGHPVLERSAGVHLRGALGVAPGRPGPGRCAQPEAHASCAVCGRGRRFACGAEAARAPGACRPRRRCPQHPARGGAGRRAGSRHRDLRPQRRGVVARVPREHRAAHRPHPAPHGDHRRRQHRPRRHAVARGAPRRAAG
ncbi:MAG: hypothetical protein MZW92_14775 [Comamonadaceae bacterium]|nr:hypothetical protein [Comamonadaceae bacterium]